MDKGYIGKTQHVGFNISLALCKQELIIFISCKLGDWLYDLSGTSQETKVGGKAH